MTAESIKKYEPKLIDPAILSVLNVDAAGKVVTADVWKTLWNLVITSLNYTTEYCTDIDDLVLTWKESEHTLQQVIEEFNKKYETLKTGFIYYGENPPEDPNYSLWVQPIRSFSDTTPVTKLELIESLFPKANTDWVMQQLGLKADKAWVEEQLKNVDVPTVGTALGNGNEIFNDYSSNKAGTRAFNILSANSSENSITLDSVEGIVPEYVCSVNSGTNWDFFGKVVNIVDNKIYVDVFPKSFSLKEGAILWIPEHPELGTIEVGSYIHTEGFNNIASLVGAHAEGGNNIAGGKYAHVEGNGNIAGYAAHAEGYHNQATGLYSHAEGGYNISSNEYAHTEGRDNVASGLRSHAEGSENQAKGSYSHAEGESTEAIGTAAHAEGKDTSADGNGAHSEGWGSVATGHGAHAEGYGKVNGDYAHAEGYDTNSTAPYAHAEGNVTVASGQASHAEGNHTTASGNGAHSEGATGSAIGDNSHSEGISCTADAKASHAEGWSSKAQGEGSHAENYSTAKGKYSHSSGYGTVAGYDHQFVTGDYNANKADTLFEIGNGSASARSNALEVKKDGSLVIGGVTITPTQLTKLLALIAE